MKIQCYITACWPVSGITSAADNIILTRSFAIKSPADQDPVLYKCILARFGIRSPADHDPVSLYLSMLARFVWYKIACSSRSGDI